MSRALDLMASNNKDIPLLTDIVESRLDETRPHRILDVDGEPSQHESKTDDRENAKALDESTDNADQSNEIEDIEAVIAELQTRIASKTYELADDLMRTTFADMEARIFRQISSKLREQLPELIDSICREHLVRDPEDSTNENN